LLAVHRLETPLLHCLLLATESHALIRVTARRPLVLIGLVKFSGYIHGQIVQVKAAMAYVTLATTSVTTVVQA